MKGLLVFSHGMEDVEALATLALLRRSGYEVITVTNEDTLAIKSAYGVIVQADAFVGNMDTSTFDFLVIPGGPYVGKIIDTDQKITDMAATFAAAGKVVAAICAGPLFLHRAGLLNGKDYTVFPSCQHDIDAGHYRASLKAVTDGDIITARGAGAVYEFAYQIVKRLSGEKSAQALLESIIF